MSRKLSGNHPILAEIKKSALMDKQPRFIEKMWLRKRQALKIKLFTLNDMERIRRLWAHVLKQDMDSATVCIMIEKLIIEIGLSAYPAIDSNFINEMTVEDVQDVLGLIEEVNRFGWGKKLVIENDFDFWMEEAEGCLI
jgi:hypothetical protein